MYVRPASPLEAVLLSTTAAGSLSPRTAETRTRASRRKKTRRTIKHPRQVTDKTLLKAKYSGEVKS